MTKGIELGYCPTKDQIANIFAKPLGKDKFERFESSLAIMVNELATKGSCESD